MPNHHDTGISFQKPLPPPGAYLRLLPASERQLGMVQQARDVLSNIICGKDDRLAVIVGPCSIHDVTAARDYAGRLDALRLRLADDLFIVMRTYFEKPRTTAGWKGLINDPHLDGSCDIAQGLQLARSLLLDLASIGLPAGSEFLDGIAQLSLLDLMSWYAIGARTTESQPHREMASGLPTVTGFKNNRDGNIQAAINAVRVARSSHHFCSIDMTGNPVITTTTGNNACHIILRGSIHGPNYHAENRQNAVRMLLEADLCPYLMIDCSHGNSQGNYQNQIKIANQLAEQIACGEKNLCGIMLESNLIAGQQLPRGKSRLNYGQSVTDACISWKDTSTVLEQLAFGVSQRRKTKRKSAS